MSGFIIGGTSIATPVGAIIAWIGGYFGDGSNGSYTRVLGSANTVAAANTYLNPLGWYVCDGAALNDSDSPIFKGASRYLPKMTDSRFFAGGTIAGDTSIDDSGAAGGSVGSSTIAAVPATVTVAAFTLSSVKEVVPGNSLVKSMSNTGVPPIASSKTAR